MISLRTPASGVDRYFLWNGWIVGPYGTDGLLEEETITFSSPVEKLIQGSGMWHEKAVTHEAVNGSFDYVLGKLGIVPVPLVNAPKQAKLQVIKADGTGGTTYLTGKYGLGSCGGAATFYDTFAINASCVLQPSSGSFEILWMNTARTYPKLATALFKYRIKSITRLDDNRFTVKWTSQQYSQGSGGISIPQGMFACNTQGAIEEVFSRSPVIFAESALNTSTITHNKLKPMTAFSPSGVSAEILSFVLDLAKAEYAIPDLDYGELAMRAANNVNANKTNMLEFLRDMRHPSEMLLKLRNFSKLKTMANNYLAVSFGVLPTISDIEDIIGAFKKAGPYLDRNGFSTYTASYTDSVVEGTVTYTLEQRLKLAIAEEDNGFEALIERLDSMGTLPTFENLWDLLPYSFLVDWLVDVGGFLERIDTRLRLLRLNIRYVTMSRKTITSQEISAELGLPYFGTIERVQYHRWVSNQCPEPPLLLDPTFIDFTHWVTSTALIVSRRKR